MKSHQISRKAAAKKGVKSRVARIPKSVPPTPQFVQPVAMEMISDAEKNVHDRLELMRQRINALESEVARLRSVISISGGDVDIVATGKIHIYAHQDVIVDAAGNANIWAGSAVSVSSSTVEVSASGSVAIEGSTIDIDGSDIDLNAPMCDVAGALSCTVLTASASVVSPAYTPGAGNIW
ncbi:hypothetical protein E1180_20035 [Roseibium denhamense]|uniref:DUF2345 domain-containing protein n=1 Tax=Roseibium denhamense TaxID=76305 RepID=A0ABY1PEK1_9HYPH|nr:hypothetical protein [Roseibium denhamense]MTI07797.1 hypothetical protein [Roseibium denhamense]SMP32091.1 hypothetical protein SAMN06265374_3472 [Roseibium denhamense]